MAEKLLTADLIEWYRKLNVARTQSGVGLSAINRAGIVTGAKLQNAGAQHINNIANDIFLTTKANSFLGLTTDSTREFTQLELIDDADKKAIEDTLVSMLRVCPNVTCQTQLVSEAKDTNGADGNGSKYNGDSTCSDWYMCAHNGSGFGGLQDAGWAGSAANWIGVWGTSGSTNWHGTHTKGSWSNGGNANQYYKEGTATYSAKDHYTEAEAKGR